MCNKDISKTVKARSFKLGQLIEDDEWITWCSLIGIFTNYLPLQIWTLKCCSDISSDARSFKLGKLIEDDEWDYIVKIQMSVTLFFRIIVICIF